MDAHVRFQQPQNRLQVQKLLVHLIQTVNVEILMGLNLRREPVIVFVAKRIIKIKEDVWYKKPD